MRSLRISKSGSLAGYDRASSSGCLNCLDDDSRVARMTDAYNHITRPRVFGGKDLGKRVDDGDGCKAQTQEAVCCAAGSQAGPTETQEKYPSVALNEFGDAL